MLPIRKEYRQHREPTKFFNFLLKSAFKREGWLNSSLLKNHAAYLLQQRHERATPSHQADTLPCHRWRIDLSGHVCHACCKLELLPASSAESDNGRSSPEQAHPNQGELWEYSFAFQQWKSGLCTFRNDVAFG